MSLDDRVELAWRVRPARGEYRSGDLPVVVADGPARKLIALIDGLGHGPKAAHAAESAAAFLRAHAQLPLDELFERCSAAIEHTRGVALTVLRLHAEPFHFEHAGIGNVALTGLTRSPLELRPTPGIVGRSLRKLQVRKHPLHAGDLLLLYTDGISSRLKLEQLQRASAGESATAIMSAHAKHHDDASCIVIVCA